MTSQCLIASCGISRRNTTTKPFLFVKMPSHTLTAGVIESVTNDVVPEHAIVQVLATKPVSDPSAATGGRRKVRAVLSDGVHRFSTALFLVPTDDSPVKNITIPSNLSIIDIHNSGTDSIPNNHVQKIEGKLIWIINHFKHLSNEKTRIGDPQPYLVKAASQPPSTPIQRANEEENAPKPPSKATSWHPGGDNKRGENGEPAAKRALFSSPTKPSASAPSSLHAVDGPSNKASLPAALRKASHEISGLNPYVNKYTIKARVTHKSELKTWSNSRGEGQVFNVTLQDHSGDIKATGFKEDALKFHPVFEVNKVYFVSDARVGPIKNKAYNNTSHQYEVIFNQNSRVEPCRDAGSDVPKIRYDFKSLEEVQTMAVGNTVDVCGYCSQSEDIQERSVQASSRQVMKRDINLVDPSGSKGNEMKMTLWAEEAETFDGLNKIVAVKGARIKEWQGAKNLQCSFGSILEVDPDIDRAHIIRGWWDDQGRHTFGGSGATQGKQSSQSGAEQRTCIYDMKKDFQGIGDSTTGKFYTIVAHLIEMKSDRIAYEACPNPDCNKKITKEASDEYRCSKCNKVYPNFNWRYIIRGIIADETDYQWVTMFDDVAKEILGTSANDLIALRDSDERGYQKVMKDACFRKYLFGARGKIESWNDENRLKLELKSVKSMRTVTAQDVERLRKEVEDLKAAVQHGS